MSEEHKVVIAAAIAALTRRPVRITAIREFEETNWARLGRLSIQSSHGPKAPLIRMMREWGPERS